MWGKFFLSLYLFTSHCTNVHTLYVLYLHEKKVRIENTAFHRLQVGEIIAAEKKKYDMVLAHMLFGFSTVKALYIPFGGWLCRTLYFHLICDVANNVNQFIFIQSDYRLGRWLQTKVKTVVFVGDNDSNQLESLINLDWKRLHSYWIGGVTMN